MFKTLWFGILLWIASLFLLAQVAWATANPSYSLLLAQADRPADTGAVQPADSSAPTSDRPSSAQPSLSDQDSDSNKASNSRKTSSEPRNPYDMEALKAFDAGSHRSN
jgi:hypothetical protein